MTIFLVIAGIVGLALDTYFNGQETISWVLIAFGVAGLIIQAIVTLFVAKQFKTTRDRFSGRSNWGRNL